jgi:hypothetical protein
VQWQVGFGQILGDWEKVDKSGRTDLTTRATEVSDE